MQNYTNYSTSPNKTLFFYIDKLLKLKIIKVTYENETYEAYDKFFALWL